VLAILIAAAAAAKVADPARFASDLTATFTDAGFPSWVIGLAHPAAWAFMALELALVAGLLVRRTSAAALAIVVAIVGAGVLLVGLAGDWGARDEPGCPCRLAFVGSVLQSGFAMLLFRDACIVLLVALAWPCASEGRPAPAAIRG
jgi:hypothetical protein